MPRKANKKQTRLAFAPTVPSGDANETESDRFARLSYGHPSFSTVRPEMPSQIKHESPPVEASSLIATTSPRKAASVKESKQEKKEKNAKEKGKKDKKAKKEKKSKLNEQQAEGKFTRPTLVLW
jgi:hypothetical protein